MNRKILKDISSGIGTIFLSIIILLAVIGSIAFFIASPAVRSVIIRIVFVLILIGISYGVFRWAKDEGYKKQDNSLWKIFGILFLISLFVYTLRSTTGCDTSNYHEDSDTGIAVGNIDCPTYIEEQHKESAKKNAIYFLIVSSVIAGIGYSRGTKQKEQAKQD